jgi:excisionase family DNA binding protein
MAGVREKLLTASDLASLCEVDLKTIHNWVDRGRIAHFRTPGRHLRFRAADVADFLRAWGYTVPRELARQSSRTVLIVGSKDTAAHVTRALGEGLPLRHAAHPYDALVLAGSEPADVYVVDLKDVARDVDADAMLEALHRASTQATFVVLSDEVASVPSFASRVGRSDVHALRILLAPAHEGGAAPKPAVHEGGAAPKPAINEGGSATKPAGSDGAAVTSTTSPPVEEALRGVAAGGGSH